MNWWLYIIFAKRFRFDFILYSTALVISFAVFRFLSRFYDIFFLEFIIDWIFGYILQFIAFLFPMKKKRLWNALVDLTSR